MSCGGFALHCFGEQLCAANCSWNSSFQRQWSGEKQEKLLEGSGRFELLLVIVVVNFCNKLLASPLLLLGCFRGLQVRFVIWPCHLSVFAFKDRLQQWRCSEERIVLLYRQ